MPIIKASLMLFLRRIFGHVRVFRLALWAVGAYVFLWWLTTFWMSIFQCWPISSNWGTTPEEMGNCIPNYMVRRESRPHGLDSMANTIRRGIHGQLS